MEGVLPWANGGAHKPCRLQGQFKEEGRDFLELIWWSQNKWLPWFSWENIIAFLNFFFFFTKEISDAIDQRVYRETWVRIQRGWCRVLKPLKPVAQPPCGRSRGRKWLWTGATLRSVWVDVGFDRLKMAPQIRPEWVVSGHLPKALRQQGQSENAHGQSWIGSEDVGRKS